MVTIPYYPMSVNVNLGLRPMLHPMFKTLSQGISEFTFANLYLFRNNHGYTVSMVETGRDQSNEPLIVITGKDDGHPFFMLPFGIPDREVLDRLFQTHRVLKCVSVTQVDHFAHGAFKVVEDRDNFDYLYLQAKLANLDGRKYHKKRNLIKAFVRDHEYEGRPLLDEYIPHALEVLDQWRENREDDGDYIAAREALEKCNDLQLCGGVYYVGGRPVAYSLGEELACGTSFVVHFEKAVPGYKGLWQFVNQAFASILTDYYTTVNREQDLGNAGLRKAKMSYQPSGFVKKYRVMRSIEQTG